MNVDQVTEMLEFINGFDPRRVVNPETIDAWSGLFDRVEAADAMQAVRDYYMSSATNDTLMPATIIQRSHEISARRAEQQAAELDQVRATCGRSGCKCTHTGECDAGWIDAGRQGNGNDQVRPCPMCRPEVTSIAASAASRRHFQTLIRDKDLRAEVSSQTAWD